MPRKVDPRWGEDGYFDPPEFSFPTESSAELTDILREPLDSSGIDYLISTLNFIGTKYRNWQNRGPGAFSRAEAHKALIELNKMDRIDCSLRFDLNERALHMFLDQLILIASFLANRHGTVTDALYSDEVDEKHLRKAIHATISNLKTIKGPDLNFEIPWAVEKCILLYEVLTEEKATHSNKGKYFAYQSGPQSKAGKFVHACFKYIDPEVRGHQISGGMRHFIEKRNKSV